MTVLLFVFSIFGTHDLTSPKQKKKIVVSRAFYDVEINPFPLSFQVNDQKKNHVNLKNLRLVDQRGHFIPLDHLVWNKEETKRYPSSNGMKFYHEESEEDEADYTSKKEDYSFIVTSHIRKDLQFKATIHTRPDGMNISFSPLNPASKRYTKNKTLRLTILNDSISEKTSTIYLSRDNQKIFNSNLFNVHGYNSSKAGIKANKNHNKLTLSSNNNELFFSLNLNSLRDKSSNKVTYQMDTKTQNN